MCAASSRLCLRAPRLQRPQPKRQKTPLGTNLDTVNCAAIVENTWFNVVIGTALGQMVTWVGLLESFMGIE